LGKPAAKGAGTTRCWGALAKGAIDQQEQLEQMIATMPDTVGGAKSILSYWGGGGIAARSNKFI